MLPLPEPKLRNFLEPQPGPVKTKIALAPHQRCHALGHDVCETGEPEKLDDEGQDRYRNSPEHQLPRNLRSYHHALHLRLIGYFSSTWNSEHPHQRAGLPALTITPH